MPGDAYSSAAFDPTGLFEVADSAQRSAVIKMFIDPLEVQLPLLEAAIAANDSEAVRRLAHGLTGSAATVGADLLTDISKAIDEIASNGAAEGASALYSELVEAATRTRAVMLAYAPEMTVAELMLIVSP